MKDKKLILEAASIACDEHKEKLLPVGTKVKLKDEPLHTGHAFIAVPPHHKVKHCEENREYCLAMPVAPDKSFLIYRPYSEVIPA